MLLHCSGGPHVQWKCQLDFMLGDSMKVDVPERCETLYQLKRGKRTHLLLPAIFSKKLFKYH